MTVNEIGRLFKNSGDDSQLLDRILAIKRITESLDTTTEDNLTAVLGALRRLIGFDAATVWLIHGKGRKLYPAASLLKQVELPIRTTRNHGRGCPSRRLHCRPLPDVCSGRLMAVLTS
jgi:hypothetical protein